MKLAHPSAVKFTEPAPAVGFSDLQFPVEADVVQPPPSKRPKLVDSDPQDTEKAKPMEFWLSASQLLAGSTCPICRETGTHTSADCPLREEYMRSWCYECLGSCKDVDHHGKYEIQRLMQCDICRELGKHWSDGCPKLTHRLFDAYSDTESPDGDSYWPTEICHEVVD